MDQFIANIHSGGLKARINLEPVIEWSGGVDPDYTTLPAAYENWSLPSTTPCNYYGYYSSDDLQFNGPKQHYTGSYAGAETFTISTLGDIITALNADPRVAGYAFEGAYQNGVTWITGRAHEPGAGKTVQWWVNPADFAADANGGPQYPNNWNGEGAMGQNSGTPPWLSTHYDSTDIDARMAMVDSVTTTLYYLYNYNVHYSGLSLPESVSILQTLPYLRKHYPHVPLGITSNTYRTRNDWWTDYGAVGQGEGVQTWTAGTPSNTCMGSDGEADTGGPPYVPAGHGGYLGLDGIVSRAARYLYAQKKALGGKADFQVLSNQSVEGITSMAEQIAQLESFNLLASVPIKYLTINEA